VEAGLLPSLLSLLCDVHTYLMPWDAKPRPSQVGHQPHAAVCWVCGSCLVFVCCGLGTAVAVSAVCAGRQMCWFVCGSQVLHCRYCYSMLCQGFVSLYLWLEYTVNLASSDTSHLAWQRTSQSLSLTCDIFRACCYHCVALTYVSHALAAIVRTGCQQEYCWHPVQL